MNKKLWFVVGFLFLFVLLFVIWNNNEKDLAGNLGEQLPVGIVNFNEPSRVVLDTTNEIVENEGLQTNSMLVDSRKPNPSIEVIVKDPDDFSIQKKQEVQELVANRVYLKTNILFDVTVRTKNMAERLEENWQPIISIIKIKADDQFDEYRGLAYMFSPGAVQIMIKTHLKNSKEPSTIERVERIKEYVAEIITEKREALLLEDIPYEIRVLSKENEVIN